MRLCGAGLIKKQEEANEGKKTLLQNPSPFSAPLL